MNKPTIWDKDVIEKLSDSDYRITFPDPATIMGLEKDFIEFWDWKEKDTLLFCQWMSELIEKNLPSLCVLWKLIKQRINSGLRFVIVDGIGFEEMEEDARTNFILWFCYLVWLPSPTDKIRKQIAWDVKARKTSHSNTTFSEHDGEAEYHTDSQFYSDPEKYFSLWTVQHARDGGGISGLIDGRKLIQFLENESQEALSTLRNELFPFRVPSVFTKDGHDGCIEVLQAPILWEIPIIRYRKDTLQKWILATSQLSPSQECALKVLESAIHNGNFSLNFFLKKGDVIFANNHELLHSRSSFTDHWRHLVRVRMN